MSLWHKLIMTCYIYYTALVPSNVVIYWHHLKLGLNTQKFDDTSIQTDRQSHILHCEAKQELSYRKQVARQLCTQFIEGISVTLKSTLRVTQDRWKRNHWTDHTQLTSRRVIGRWILLWPWNVVQRSLKVIEISATWKFGCGFLFAFYSNWSYL